MPSSMMPPTPQPTACSAYASLPSGLVGGSHGHHSMDAAPLVRSSDGGAGGSGSDDGGGPEEVVRRLEDERHRCEQLMQHNHVLRQQLDESHRTNAALSVDLQKLTGDWEQMRDDMAAKEEEWKEEEQVSS